MDEKVLSANVPIEGPFALSVDLSIYGRARLNTVLSGQHPQGGMLVIAEYAAEVVKVGPHADHG